MEVINKNEITKTDFGLQFTYCFGNNEYTVQMIFPKPSDDFKIPYILVMPKEIKNNCMLAVEVNNYETENYEELKNKALITARNLTLKLSKNNNPIVVPIIPSVNDGIPYFQQLSRECFDVSNDSLLYRIDLQVLSIINDAKERVSKNAQISEKIFLNGYSSSGIFAQRFALLHPEIVDTLCVGGASGSIPVPINKLAYPLGISDYYEITGHNFDIERIVKLDLDIMLVH